MVIIEACPKCGADIMDTILCTYPPIPHKQCKNPKCDWSWTGKIEEINRLPFKEYSNVME